MNENDWSEFAKSLVLVGRARDMEDLLEQWLAAGLSESPPAAKIHRLKAGIGLVLGNGFSTRGRSFRDRWAPHLCAALWRNRDQGAVSFALLSILRDGDLCATRAGRKLYRDLSSELDQGLGSWSFARIEGRLDLLASSEAAKIKTHAEVLKKQRNRLLTRWSAKPSELRDQIIARIALGSGDDAFKTKVHAGLAQRGSRRARALAESLFESGVWKRYAPESERHLIALFTELARSVPETGETRELLERKTVGRLIQLSDWMLRGRKGALIKEKMRTAVESIGTRAAKELRKKLVRQAQKECAKVLNSLGAAGYRGWIDSEALALLTQAADSNESQSAFERDLDALRRLLTKLDADPAKRSSSQRTLAARLSYCSLASALKTPEPKASLRSLLKISEEKLVGPYPLVTGRYLHFLADVVQDSEETRERLGEWYGNGQRFEQLRGGILLAHWLASEGQFKEAIATMESVAALDSIAAKHLEALASWYAAEGDAKAQAEAYRRSYRARGPQGLLQQLRNERRRYESRGNQPPEDLPESVPQRFITLLQTATSPSSAVYELSRYYRATRDFRLLEALPLAAVGMSPGQALTALSAASRIASTIPDEAAVDRLLRTIDRLAKDPGHHKDRRALALVESRLLLGARGQLEGGEVYAPRILKALEEGTQGSWSPSEARSLAAFLKALPQSEDSRVDSLIERRLRECLKACPAGWEDHLEVASLLAQFLSRHSRHDEAAALLADAIASWRGRHGGLLQSPHFGPFRTLIAELNSQGLYREGERLWRKELTRGYGASKLQSLRRGLHNHCLDAFVSGHSCSHGRGAALYHGLRQEILQELKTERQARNAAQLIERLGRLHREAKKKGIGDPGKDWSEIVWSVTPALIESFHHHDVHNIIHYANWNLFQLRDNAEALRYLVTRGEATPSSVIWLGDDFWSSHAYRLNNYRRNLGAALDSKVAEGLLRLVLKEMRERFGFNRWRNHAIYDDDDNDYWSAKAAAFRDTALLISQNPDDSEPAKLKIADYLWKRHLERTKACEILLNLQRQGLLSPSGRHTLATYLRQIPGREKESVLLLEALIAESPKVLRYRLSLLRSLHALNDEEGVTRVLDETSTSLKKLQAWSPANAAELAKACAAINRRKDAIRFYRSALKRARSEGGSSPYTWSLELARNLGKLGRTSEAVDALSGAWTHAGRSLKKKLQIRSTLGLLLAAAKDIDSFIAEVDGRAKSSGQENPVLRREIGRLLLKRGRAGDAIRHLRVALELGRPLDSTRDLLVEALDEAGHPEEADEIYLEAARNAGPKALDSYLELAKRYQSRGLETQAERARTQLIELQPLEAPSHAKLAGVRESAGHLRAALELWRRVSEIRPEEPRGLINQIRLLKRLEQPRKAKKLLETLRRHPWHHRFDKVVKKALSQLGD